MGLKRQHLVLWRLRLEEWWQVKASHDIARPYLPKEYGSEEEEITNLAIAYSDGPESNFSAPWPLL